MFFFLVCFVFLQGDAGPAGEPGERGIRVFYQQLYDSNKTAYHLLFEAKDNLRRK